MDPFKIFTIVSILFFLVGCEDHKTDVNLPTSDLSFTKLEKSHTNVTFINKITEVPQLNYFNFPYMYNGAGVAIGDIDNDGLQDIYFIGNMTQNRLYRNTGDFVFEDITDKAGISGQNDLRWSNGVSMADVNNDGWLDIYICASGPFRTRKNPLYINNGDLTFTERSSEFGLDDNGYSTQSVFFDYDRDGDLDVYIGTYAPTSLEATNTYYVEKNKSPKEEEKDKLYRNDGNVHFTDVTDAAGLTNFGLTLSASVSDFNNDGWPDIYVSNDFNSPDFYYINNGDGTFTDALENAMNHTANFGMGSDAADINNDGLIDILQLDMGSSSNEERKRNMSSMAPELFHEAVKLGLHHQYMKNNLQLNNGDGTFSEIAELAGFANTDWSWSVLAADLNNDRWKDIFIGNGMRRNVNDNDFNNYDRLLQKQGKIHADNRYLLIDKMPVKAQDNYAYVNQGNLRFKTKEGNWGLSHVGFTQGTAYSDLDNDGDLDMVMNNLDDYAAVYRNNAVDSFPQNNYLRIKLKGTLDNTFGIGAKIRIVADSSTQHQEMMPTRGYLSSVEPLIHFGLGTKELIDTVEVVWPNGNAQRLFAMKANKTLEIVQQMKNDLIGLKSPKKKIKKLFVDITNGSRVDYMHKENVYDDFTKEILLPHKMSHQGPTLSTGDINGDGLVDFFIGGSKGFSGRFYVQKEDATFIPSISTELEKDKDHEDVSSVLFDIDNDNDLDLYLVSGGNEEPIGSPYYADRLYLNNGEGEFIKADDAIPQILSSGSKVKAADYDADGDLDLFVGGRQIPSEYPFPASSYLLRNDSDGDTIKLTDVTDKYAPMLNKIGMVTDALWTDFDNDGAVDLVLVGEWMPISLFRNNEGIFEDVTVEYGLDKQVGWWYSIASADMDNDGDQDLIAGNLGLNYKYKASNKEPFEVFSDDFDRNGSNDIVLGYHEKGNLFPLRGRQCTSDQIPIIKKKFPTYESFSKATLSDIVDKELTTVALHYRANTFASTYYRNYGGKFTPIALSEKAQISSINSIYVNDMDADGYKDLVIAGNLYQSEVETPRNDASYGLYLKNKGDGSFESVPNLKSGLKIRGEVREIHEIPLANDKIALLIVRNENSLLIYGTELMESKNNMAKNSL